MDKQNTKCVMVIDESLPLGLITNTAAVLGVTLGKQNPHVLGPDVFDQSGHAHLGITAYPIPILRGTPQLIKAIRQRLYEPAFSSLTVVDFSHVAQGCNSYDDFMGKMAQTPEAELVYFGIAIFGEKKRVNQLTGSMPLLR